MKPLKSGNDALAKVFFLIGFFMMAFACFVLYTFFLERYAILFVLSVIFTALYTYSFTSYFYNKNIEKHTRDLTKAIHKLFRDDSDFNLPADKNFSDVFAALAVAKNTLAQRENREEEIRSIIISAANCPNFDDMLKGLLENLISAADSLCGAFYFADEFSGMLKLKYSVGFSKNIYDNFDMAKGEGLIGAAASQSEITVINNIPDDTKYIMRTVLGNIKPKSIVIVPIVRGEASIGAFVLSGLHDYSEEQIKFLDAIRDYLGILISNL